MLISIWFIFLYFFWLGLLVLPFILFGLFIIGFSSWVEQFGFFLWLGKSWIISLGKPLTIRIKLLTEKKKKKMCVCVLITFGPNYQLKQWSASLWPWSLECEGGWCCGKKSSNGWPNMILNIFSPCSLSTYNHEVLKFWNSTSDLVFWILYINIISF